VACRRAAERKLAPRFQGKDPLRHDSTNARNVTRYSRHRPLSGGAPDINLDGEAVSRVTT
jgi:hypothetical protein